MDRGTTNIGVTRRLFLGRTTVAAAAAGTALVPVLSAQAAAGTDSARLSGRRKRNFHALVTAVATSPGTLVEESEASRATAVLARRYAAEDPATCAHIDAVLDELDKGLLRPFAALGRSQRFDVLASALEAESDRSLARTRASHIRDAVALAAAPFHPSGFRWDADAVALWVRVTKARAARKR